MRKILILLAFNIPMAVLIFLVMSRAIRLHGKNVYANGEVFGLSEWYADRRIRLVHLRR